MVLPSPIGSHYNSWYRAGGSDNRHCRAGFLHHQFRERHCGGGRCGGAGVLSVLGKVLRQQQRRPSAFSTPPTMLSLASPSDRGDLLSGNAAVLGLSDYSGEAVQYFDSLRTPAALIAGSALAGLFTCVKLLQKPEAERRSSVENFSISFYHILSLVSLLLSINVIVTATATGNALLLSGKGRAVADVLATSPYALLEREFQFEFLECRWSFYASMLSFMWSVALRALISFRLFIRQRRYPMVVIVMSLSSLTFHLLNVINENLRGYPNFGAMTFAMVRLYVWRTLMGRNMCGLASLGAAIAAIAAGAVAVHVVVNASYDAPMKKLDQDGTDAGGGGHR